MCANVRSVQNGGGGGSPFSDDLTEACALVGVNIRHGGRVDAIQGIYSTPSGVNVPGPRYGGSGGTLDSFTLVAGEFITRVDGRSGNSIDSLQFTTNKGNVFGPYGGGGGNVFSALTGLQVMGFFGRSGAELDAVGFFTPGTCP